MGRIKTQFIKRITNELLDRHGDRFTADFSQNKVVRKSLISVDSNKIRNLIAGYAAHLVGMRAAKKK